MNELFQIVFIGFLTLKAFAMTGMLLEELSFGEKVVEILYEVGYLSLVVIVGFSINFIINLLGA